MISKLVAFVAIIQSVLAANTIVLAPTVSITAKDIAVVWINGAESSPSSYVKIAKAFQAEASLAGFNAWVGIPSFTLDTPNPVQIAGAVRKAKSDLAAKGFTAVEYYIAAHSLGTVMAQDWVQYHADEFKGQILMGGGILRDFRSNNNNTGLTHFDTVIPTLTIAATKDGLYRVTRAAEGYWHGVENVEADQKGQFPVVLLEGGSHGSFMDEDILPALVKKDDLLPEISQDAGHKQVGEMMVNFIKFIRGEGEDVNQEADAPAVFLKPIIDSLIMEGSYHIKIPCYNISTINPDWPTKCERGNKWTTQASYLMAGDLAKDHVTLEFFDNFHRVDSMFPHHLPQIQDWKTCSGKANCTLKGWTVSENYYGKVDSAMDTGAYPQSALETKAKMLSKQMIEIHSGQPDANFTETDDNHLTCKMINEKALEQGLSMASKEAVDRYNKFGKKLVMGEDKGPLNAGPLWIWTYLSFTDNADKTETTVVAPYMSTPADYWEPQVRGFHYCKLLNPSRVVEWIYIDSLYDRNGRTPYSEKYPQETMFLQ